MGSAAHQAMSEEPCSRCQVGVTTHAGINGPRGMQGTPKTACLAQKEARAGFCLAGLMAFSLGATVGYSQMLGWLCSWCRA